MYEVPRTHCQSSTEQPTGLAAEKVLQRFRVPSQQACSSPVMTTTAFRKLGKYQKLGNGWLSIARIWRAKRRCCTSACGIAMREKSTQSGCGSPEAAPKNWSSERIGATPSRSVPAQAGLPWWVSTTERARSNAQAPAWPPFEPTLFSVTAGKADAAEAVDSEAIFVAEPSVYWFAGPWYCSDIGCAPQAGSIERYVF